MFRIIQSLNNNAALVKNEHGEQAVVMGLGITFQKKKGDLIVKDKIENIFSL
ncbi:TPA: CAT RNA binding domain-containing protein, partial [Streptococcus suis]